MEWIEVLNIIDDEMNTIIEKNVPLFLSDKPKPLGTPPIDNDEVDEKVTSDDNKRNICVILKFTISLLDNAVNKEIYSSVEV